MRWIIRIFCEFWLASLLTNGYLTADAQSVTPTIAIVLDVQGNATYTRSGESIENTLLSGVVLTQADATSFSKDTSLLILCSGGQIVEYLPGELASLNTIVCPEVSEEFIYGEIGERRLIVRRGGRQDATIPYVISPRGTIMTSPQVTLRWNAVAGAEAYSVTLLGPEGSYFEDEFFAFTVEQPDGTAVYDLPQVLKQGLAYTVKICVDATDDRHSGCTTDPGWSTNENLSFYHYPMGEVQVSILNNILNILGEDNAMSLFAQAVILSQPSVDVGTGEFLGAYGEAITLLEQLLLEYPDSPLAQSPYVYNRLGTLYSQIYLPESAKAAFEEAFKLAIPDSEAARISEQALEDLN